MNYLNMYCLRKRQKSVPILLLAFLLVEIKNTYDHVYSFLMIRQRKNSIKLVKFYQHIVNKQHDYMPIVILTLNDEQKEKTLLRGVHPLVPWWIPFEVLMQAVLRVFKAVERLFKAVFCLERISALLCKYELQNRCYLEISLEFSKQLRLRTVVCQPSIC